MQRIEYREPAVNVVMLQHQSQLLTGSKGNSGVEDYTWHNEEEE